MNYENYYFITANYTKEKVDFKNIVESYIKNLVKKPLKYWQLTENSVKYNQSKSSY